MTKEKLSFPVTREVFTRYQAAGVGRNLVPYEQEALSIWVPLFNQCFEDGRRNDIAALRDFLDMMDGYISMSDGDPVLSHFLKACRYWMAYAWKQGRAGAAV